MHAEAHEYIFEMPDMVRACRPRMWPTLSGLLHYGALQL